MGTALTPKTIWGKVVLYLREHRQVALHVACGDITDVNIEGGRLEIGVNENMILSLLEEGKDEIKKALRWQGFDYEIAIILKEEKTPKAEEDLNKLNNIFENVKII